MNENDDFVYQVRGFGNMSINHPALILIQERPKGFLSKANEQPEDSFLHRGSKETFCEEKLIENCFGVSSKHLRHCTPFIWAAKRWWYFIEFPLQCWQVQISRTLCFNNQEFYEISKAINWIGLKKNLILDEIKNLFDDYFDFNSSSAWNLILTWDSSTSFSYSHY